MASDAQADQANGERLTADGQDAALPGSSLAAFGPPAPGWLRLARGGAGIALLVGAWGALLAAVVLGQQVMGLAARQPVLVRMALYGGGLVGVVWLATVGITAVVVGAFCLALALRNRGW